MAGKPSKSEVSLLQLSSQWGDLPIELRLEIAGRVAKKIYENRVSRVKRIVIGLCVAGGLAGIIALILTAIGKLGSAALVFGAWMFLLGALAVLAVMHIINRRP